MHGCTFVSIFKQRAFMLSFQNVFLLNQTQHSHLMAISIFFRTTKALTTKQQVKPFKTFDLYFL